MTKRIIYRALPTAHASPLPVQLPRGIIQSSRGEERSEVWKSTFLEISAAAIGGRGHQEPVSPGARHRFSLTLLYHSNFTPEQTRRFEPCRTRSRTWNDLYREILALYPSNPFLV